MIIIKTIVIDPGHGDAGKDYGAISPIDGTKEATITLQIGLTVANYLKTNGYNVILTRDKELTTYPITSQSLGDLPARVDLANNANADLWISIHCNEFTDKSAEGTEIFYANGSTNGQKLAANILNELMYLRGIKISKYGNTWNFTSRGVKPDSNYSSSGLYVCQHTNMPAILIETLFLSNLQDLNLLHSQEYQFMVAMAIKEGIDSYFSAVPIAPVIPTTDKAFIDGNRLVTVARNWVGKGFPANDPNATAQCSNFVRQCLSDAGYGTVGYTQNTEDGYTDGSPSVADGFAGDNVGLKITNSSSLVPGDLMLFVGTYGDYKAGTITHVSIYAGNHNMIHRPTAGQPVQFVDIANDLSNFFEGRRLYLPSTVTPPVVVTPPAPPPVVPNDEKYNDIIIMYACKYNLPVSFVHSIIKQESDYDTNAVSSSNAKGLMQLLPATFEECCKELSIVGGDPFDSNVNIKCGCYYLSKIYNTWNNTKSLLWLISKLYNEGPNSLKSVYADSVISRI